METPPVLLLWFRRADLARAVVDSLRSVRPTRVYVAADGPRPDHPDDVAECARARAAVQTIDWPCKVFTLFRTENLGVRRAVSGALDWFFSQEESGVILEEDCLPHPEFFPYCAELLDRYRDDPRVMQVSGTNFQPCRRAGGASYSFSRYAHVWGWATWRRAWARYRGEFEGLEDFFDQADRTGFWDGGREQKYWRKVFGWAQSGRVDSWAYRWNYTLWAEGGLCVYPEANLVKNLGFGDRATNTVEGNSLLADRPWGTLGPLVHPVNVARHRQADRWTFGHLYWGTPRARMTHRYHQAAQLLWIPFLKVVLDLAHRAS